MKIINFGSINIDKVYTVVNFANPGETVLADSLSVYPGGKGLNQSIAISRAGANVVHVGAIGTDGMFLKKMLYQNGVDVSQICLVEEPTGSAVIQVNKEGQNEIIVFSGANNCLDDKNIETALSLADPTDIVLLQNEINNSDRIIHMAHKRGLYVVWNPSPFPEMIKYISLKDLDCIILNETEGYQMIEKSGKTISHESLINVLQQLYPDTTIVLTLGQQGVVCAYKGKIYKHNAFKVNAVDTTAAGDTFCGFFLAGYCMKHDITECLRMASAAAAISVKTKGAARSIPTYGDVKNFLKAKM